MEPPAARRIDQNGNLLFQPRRQAFPSRGREVRSDQTAQHHGLSVRGSESVKRCCAGCERTNVVPRLKFQINSSTVSTGGLCLASSPSFAITGDSRDPSSTARFEQTCAGLKLAGRGLLFGKVAYHRQLESLTAECLEHEESPYQQQPQRDKESNQPSDEWDHSDNR